MMLGDSGAGPSCLLVSLYGQSLTSPASGEFAGHIALCLWDVGLAALSGGETAVRAGDLGRPGVMQRYETALGCWLSRELSCFGGDLARAATFSLRLATLRLRSTTYMAILFLWRSMPTYFTVVLLSFLLATTVFPQTPSFPASRKNRSQFV